VRASALKHGVNHLLAAIHNEEKHKTMRKFVMLMFMMMIASVMAVPASAQASGGAPAATNWVALTSGFAIALAAGLAALGQGKVAGAACDSLGRNPAARPGIMVALILGLAFIESLVLFTLVIIFVKVA
jgi:F-type H+-transporting ATPase subunit c